ncbi:Patched family protein [Clavispora lusitaniae]|uniref:SSD domain-containing protein n=1 Tax=Clavispora lusitaniae (strain ATCC 42720) TaxID=306902 RepID=C4Y974_CLAL4|nr:uncharacterized protein CLUG_04751 [Clavispora lusitaniae ATCC 42720]EEQ40623.1 hypothetical protein CLUG_04751 [Clavispora lusitaniae ATCC 42720]KAF5209454.1 hypothetical protein E0198_003754 [Clavispora lusitaniae]KAF7581465.1 Patched family protein [Clavispora lusitaniae]
MFLLWFLLVGLSVASSLAKRGHCAMYGHCGKKSIFGGQLPCPSNITAPKPSEESLKILERVCGSDFPTENGVCCSYDQLTTLESNLKKVDSLISSCPACRKNFYDFFCKFTCSSDQAQFIQITGTASAVDTHKQVVTELSLYTEPKYASDFFDSCKNLKFSATNGYAMDLIGGGATNYSQFLKFLGDEKPLLGGSPFQINFEYSLPEDGKYEFSNGLMKSCDDKDYKCACSDCPISCPKLPPFRDLSKSCHVGRIPCFSFAVMMSWLAIFLFIGAYHMYLAKQKREELERLNRILEGDLDADDLEGPELEIHLSGHSSQPDKDWLTQWASFQKRMISSLETSLGRTSLLCAINPLKTLFGSALLIALCCSGLMFLDWETDPVKLWVSPSEPALQEKKYFETNFEEWFRVEQLIISSNNSSSPVLSWENIQWWFEKEQELYALREGNTTYELESLCFKPLGDTCAIESFTQYFHGDIRYLNPDNWASEVSKCADSPVNCLPTFQQPLKKNLLFSNDSVLQSQAFVVTLLLNSNSTDAAYTEQAVGYENAIQSWVKTLQQERPDLRISFSTEVSLEQELGQSTNTDVKIVVVSYLAMFLYASLALGGRIPTKISKSSLVHTRFMLGLSGILIIILSVCSAAGICAFLGLKSTLIIAEVIPFLVLAVGVDNVFLIVHEVHLLSESASDISVPERISTGIQKVGPACLISALLQVSVFLLAATVKMPAVRNFALYSAGAIAVNFLLQMSAFVALLSLDQRRLESGRMDLAPWITVQSSVHLPEGSSQGERGSRAHIEYNFAGIVRERYAPWLFAPKTRGRVLAFFLAWLGVSLALLPRIQLGLDQRMALPSQSYLVDYFDAVYEYLNVGPPVFFVVRDLDLTARPNQQAVCGKFSTCKEFSLANVLEQEYRRGDVSTLAEPASSWLDDFFAYLNPSLDQCCRVRAGAQAPDFCPPHAPPRQCEPCFERAEPPYNISMEGFPTGKNFMTYLRHWINEPSDPCPLGGKAPYSSAVHYNETGVISSYWRTSHRPLRSQTDFIVAHQNAERIVSDLSHDGLDVFAFSPFYVFFVQYDHIVSLTVATLAAALALVWVVATILIGSAAVAAVVTLVVAAVVANVAGIMAIWGVSLNAVSLVNLVICAGLAVEFTIHIARAYVTAKNDDSAEAYRHFMATQDIGSPERNSEIYPPAQSALVAVGGSVIGGITLTKLIGVAVLAFARSKIFEVYYFRMWLALVAIAAAHSLVLLPVALSMLG